MEHLLIGWTYPFPGQATLMGAGDVNCRKGAPRATTKLGKLLGLSLLVSLVLPAAEAGLTGQNGVLLSG
jgi:hypothetical protein